ncbi:Segregation and condensation protein B [Candidatus Protochlamydia naegleriophila]|uniref:Segregation and condensation protein B n=1 Tax=Candidatus Protochlamydia naegleriophila TaxID=389348 RepID=A0A0U5K180_9BACT|nr:SMC-Scp complex subunit ScpB [Candidatus Protochlamydia naegleriophila]CUI15851.1 Segregation and condensation protein B [Candidatus Protochlamydia naegleriophila]
MTKELNFFQTEVEFKTEISEEPILNNSSNTSIQVEEGPANEHSIPLDDTQPIKEEEDEFDEAPSAQIDQQMQQTIKKVIEALLFTSPEPLSLAKIREITDTLYPLRPRQLRQLIDSLRQDYIAHQRAFKLEEIAQGYALRTHEEYAPYLDILHRQRRSEKISYAATEVLAIIAYRQPITRPQIDAIRGVDSSGTVVQLIERQLIEPVGKLEAPGRPTLYATTKEFLKHFGLKDLKELANQFGNNKN